MGSKVIGFRLPDDLAMELEAKAAEHGQTMGEFVKKLVDDTLYPAKSMLGDVNIPVVKGSVVEEGSAKVDELQALVERCGKNLIELMNRLDAGDLSVKQLGASVDGLWDSLMRMGETVSKNAEFYNKNHAKLHICPDCGASLHLHRLEGQSWHLECVECGYYSPNYKATVWKKKPGNHPIPVGQ